MANQDLNSFKNLNSLRRSIVTNYSSYAKGKTFFGEKKQLEVQAKPGKYNLEIKINNKIFSSFIEVREDTIK